MRRIAACITCILIVCLAGSALCGTRERTVLTLSGENGLRVETAAPAGPGTPELEKRYPLFSFELNDISVSSADLHCARSDSGFSLRGPHGLSVTVSVDDAGGRGWRAGIVFTNNSDTVLTISNVVPLGRDDGHIYITADGPWSLARTRIHLPGRGPVGVILPDNAWELGYSSVVLRGGGKGLCALSRRTGADGAVKHRWKTDLQPGGTVSYRLYADVFDGPWQNGLRLMFQQRYLYDLQEFDETLFKRDDLAWIRNCYTLSLLFAWDHEFYRHGSGYQVDDYLAKGKRLFGGWDVVGLWPTWPTLGVDQRNQWDLYRDMPGGYERLASLSASMKKQGTRFFVAYNPWDQSTRSIDPYQGLAGLISRTGADGVVLDCRGASSLKLQAAADSVRPGVIMYSEGMAVPKDMPGIVAGRVHDAIYLPPPLNLNKFIRPDFAIFRVCQLNQGRLHREMALSFFNGYGIEMNIFGPGRPDWVETDYAYWGSLVRVLKENSANFVSRDWTPLVPSRADSVWVNRWPGTHKTLYTVLSFRPEGFAGPLFAVEPRPSVHYVSLTRHEELVPDTISGVLYLPARTAAFDKASLTTRKEGNVDCIAVLPRLLSVELRRDTLYCSAEKGDQIRVWPGDPCWSKEPLILGTGPGPINLTRAFPGREGTFVIQLFEGEELLDERITAIAPGTPRLISRPRRTEPAERAPAGMKLIKGGAFRYAVRTPDSFIPYPDLSEEQVLHMRPFYMDEYPVTNRQYARFLAASGYAPEDTCNFLRHWQNGGYPEGQGGFPVVYVSIEDARAYAAWAKKRLPCEAEWQYAAQGGDQRAWPWGAVFDSSRCNAGLDRLTAVNAFPQGASPGGIQDLVGNIWQLTGDVYDNGSHTFIIMRGGSYYHPSSSWWYVQGGPRPVDQSQMLLRVSPGFERNATAGFRCVRDAAAEPARH